MANKGDKLPTQLVPETVAKDSPVNPDQSQETLQKIVSQGVILTYSLTKIQNKYYVRSNYRRHCWLLL